MLSFWGWGFFFPQNFLQLFPHFSGCGLNTKAMLPTPLSDRSPATRRSHQRQPGQSQAYAAPCFQGSQVPGRAAGSSGAFVVVPAEQEHGSHAACRHPGTAQLRQRWAHYEQSELWSILHRRYVNRFWSTQTINFTSAFDKLLKALCKLGLSRCS